MLKFIKNKFKNITSKIINFKHKDLIFAIIITLFTMIFLMGGGLLL